MVVDEERYMRIRLGFDDLTGGGGHERNEPVNREDVTIMKLLQQ